MSKKEESSKKIEELRSLMYQLISEKEALTDTELVDVSQQLDKLLNEYDSLTNEE
jgi:uncharacterized protein YfkK (UPF0435 family)